MLRDLRYAIRTLSSNPVFTAVAVCSLGIGVGANSAIYSLADALLLRPLPVAEPSRIVTVSPVSTGQFAIESISHPDYVDLRDRSRTFDGLLAFSYSSFGFTTQPAVQPQMRFGMFVSGNYFRVLGIAPALGRGFRDEEDRVSGRDPVVVISHHLWTTELDGAPDVLGRKIWLNGTEFTIVGVAPEKLAEMDQVKPALWVPLAMAGKLWDPGQLTARDKCWLTIKGRLKPGVSLAQAASDIAAVTAALRQEYPKTDENLKLRVQTEFQARVGRSAPDTALIAMLAALSLCVLLVACANVAGLLLSRSAARAREIAVRMALGSSRVSLIRQLMLENLLLAACGAALGLLMAVGAADFFNTIPVPTDVPVNLKVALNERAFVYTLAVAVLSAFLFGLAPAARSTRVDLITSLKERDATSSRAGRLWGRNVIVGGQVALSLVLLLISGVLLQGFRSQLQQGPGFRVDRLQLMSFDPGLVRYNETQRTLFYKQLLDITRRASNVKSAALTSSIPMSMGTISTAEIVPEGFNMRKGERTLTIFDSIVTPDYFDTMQIPVLQGRKFADSDAANKPAVAIVNEQFARHYWPNQNALGKRIRLNGPAGPRVEIVGVARMSKYLWITESPIDFLYLPLAQNPHPDMTLVAESKSEDAAALVPALKELVHGIDPNMPVFDVRTMKSLYEGRAIATPNILARTVGAMGVMGLVLSLIGLYGVVSFSVSRRTREFGIRLAVGADRTKVVVMVLRQGLTVALAGVGIGLVAGIFATRAITAQLMFAFQHVSVSSFIIVSLLLLVTTTLATYAPARRASRTDPMTALREE
ncbi:MAG: ABC transporter permease [Acidobacteriaceae bacterium]|nr:ABC transporter permease [Acidobacteriaceae bacterium]